mgnify:CR=1 FL=1
MANSSAGYLPWSEKTDCSIHTNEYVQQSTLNRCFRRLLENDKWIIRFTTIFTPDKVTSAGIHAKGTKKYLKINIAQTDEKYLIPLYKEET